jgi:NADH oxidase (H2O2-forming)
LARIVIAGFGSAGYSALMSIKRKDARAGVIVIDPKKSDLMHPCGLPYSLEGLMPSESLYQNVNLQRMGAEKIEGSMEKLDTANKKAVAISGGKKIEIPYDSVILCTGSRPVIPPVDGLRDLIGKGLFPLTTVEDLDRIRKYISGRNAIVIGAGAIGLETAMALRRHLDRVTVFEMKDQVLPGVLDQDMSKIIEDHLKEKGIELRLSSRVESIMGSGSFTGVVAGGSEHEAGIGVLSAGFMADTALAAASGLEYTGNGISTDEFLRASSDGVLAAGDCMSGRSIIDGKTLAAKLATSAYKQGSLAGFNSISPEVKYRGSAGTFVTKIGDLEIAGTGYNTSNARDYGYEPVAGKIKSSILPEYFPDNPEITIKVIADRKSGRVLGAQAIGARGASDRVNIISFALEFNVPLMEIPRLELAYCPAVSEVYDPLLRAIDFAIRRM